MPTHRFVDRFRAVLWHRLISRFPAFNLTMSTRHGKLRFSNKDQIIGRSLFVTLQFEFHKIQRAIKAARTFELLAGRGGTLVDVGANLGTVCIPLVRDGTFDRAIAFEPEPQNYRYLTANIRLNRLDARVEALNSGLSSGAGELEMELSPTNLGDHRIRLGGPIGKALHDEEDRTTIIVPVGRLDDVLSERMTSLQEVALLWIDVQGHEKHVLEGGTKLLRSGVSVVAELWPYGLRRAGVSEAAFVDFASEHFEFYCDLSRHVIGKMPVGTLGSLFDMHPRDSFTDVLLFS